MLLIYCKTVFLHTFVLGISLTYIKGLKDEVKYKELLTELPGSVQ